MISVQVSYEGVERKFDTLAETAQDLTPALKRMGGYLKHRAMARYAAQDFPGLADSTVRHRALKGLHSLERKLERDVQKAKRRGHEARRDAGLAPRGAVARALARLTLGDMLERQAVNSTRGVQNRQAVLDEFRRQNFGGEAGKKLTEKQSASLGARAQRAVAKAVGGPILGQLPRTLKVRIENGSVTLESKTHQEWSEAHNEGLTAGHGAKMPVRATIKLDAQDLDIFRGILIEELLIPFTSME
jgi:hypothetical protein